MSSLVNQTPPQQGGLVFIKWRVGRGLIHETKECLCHLRLIVPFLLTGTNYQLQLNFATVLSSIIFHHNCGNTWHVTCVLTIIIQIRKINHDDKKRYLN